MSAREQADSVSQSRKAFKGLGGGGLYQVPHFPPSVVGCGPGGWLFMFLEISTA